MNNENNPSETGTKKKKSLPRYAKIILGLGIIGFVLGSSLIVSVVIWASNDLPSLTKIADYQPALSSTILARDGTVVGEIYDERRYLIELSQLPTYLPLAFISAEDKDFYSHSGISLTSILRAAIANFKSGSTSQGGSTITQQVVKRLLLTPERTYTRKIKEALLAFKLEEQLSKDEILTIYLNQIHMGAISYGVEAGARYYFSKHAADLTIAESALLAGILPATTRYNPYRNPEAARSRQEYVLGRMRADGVINDDEYEEAFYQELEFISMDDNTDAFGGWYVEEVRRQIIDLFSEENSKALGFDMGIYGEQAVNELGLTVTTSMDPIAQRNAEIALKDGLERASKRHGWRGPIKNISPPAYAEYLEKKRFKPANLANNKWVEALVISVDRAGAKVRLDETYDGFIDVVSMGWGRRPNIEHSGDEYSRAIAYATTVLKPGDIVYVRYYTKEEKDNFIAIAADKNPLHTEETINNARIKGVESITEETVIPLALEQLPSVQGALIAIEPKTTDVVAIVGGYQFGGTTGSHFNRATQAFRQPGSSYKPIVYSAALDNGYTLDTDVLDAPIVLMLNNEVWRPTNFSSGFTGKTNLRVSLARSINLVTVRVAQDIGMTAIVERAKDLQLDGTITENLAASLGAIEVTPISMAKAYSAFAYQGLVPTPRFIQSIQSASGKVIYEVEAVHDQGISAQNAYLVSNMLRYVVQAGTAAKLNNISSNISLGGKTGTTNEEVDAWYIGITPDLVAATYVGYDQPRPMGRGETGAIAAMPIYRTFAEKTLQHYPPASFDVPQGINFYNIDNMRLPFKAGTVPTNPYRLANGEYGETEKSRTEASESLLMQIF